MHCGRSPTRVLRCLRFQGVGQKSNAAGHSKDVILFSNLDSVRNINLLSLVVVSPIDLSANLVRMYACVLVGPETQAISSAPYSTHCTFYPKTLIYYPFTLAPHPAPPPMVPLSPRCHLYPSRFYDTLVNFDLGCCVCRHQWCGKYQAR